MVISKRNDSSAEVVVSGHRLVVGDLFRVHHYYLPTHYRLIIVAISDHQTSYGKPGNETKWDGDRLVPPPTV
jgi:hypothetical protein